MLDSKKIWSISAPTAWPSAPTWISYSSLTELETCPRRWSLNSASYPDIWNGHGYPRPLHRPAIEGSVIHLSLETITHGLLVGNCLSVSDSGAIAVIRKLGGISAILARSIDEILEQFRDNPRAVPVFEEVRNQLKARVPEFRSRVQSLLSRIRIQPSLVTKLDDQRDGKKVRSELPNGSYAEIEIRAPEIGWRGIVDLLTLTDSYCEIRDYKSGQAKEGHEFQLKVYALLWARDRELNPLTRLASSLVISYDNSDEKVNVPEAEHLDGVEDEIRSRTKRALEEVNIVPPPARPSVENCAYCSVRQLCSEYWDFLGKEAGKVIPAKGCFSVSLR